MTYWRCCCLGARPGTRQSAGSGKWGLATPLAPGTMTVDRDKVAASGGGISLTFTYTAANDGYGLKAGTVMLTVPDGWTAPSSEPGAPGYVQTPAPSAAGYSVPPLSNLPIAA